MGEQMEGHFSSVSRALWGLGQLFSLKGEVRLRGKEESMVAASYWSC